MSWVISSYIMFLFVITAALLGVVNGKTVQVHPNLPLLEGRIAGGHNTTIEEHPYQLSLERLSMLGMHVCGASLIRPNVVLTAAHCTNGYDPKDLRIRAGTTTKRNGGETAKVVNICQHPEFHSQTLDYDVSILTLDRDLPLGSNIQTISLQSSNIDIPEGTEATVTGWGALYFGGLSQSILQEVNVYRVSDANCKSTYSKYGYTITKNMICFGYPEGGKDACSKDSGGPIVVDGKQVGIVSFGIRCALPNVPGVYANVASEHIANHINSCLANV